MTKAKDFKDTLSDISPQNFEARALALFRWQARHNAVYQQYIHHLGTDVQAINHLTEIPFLPITFYKNHRIVSTIDPKETFSTYFESSGTTGQRTSRHYVKDTAFYLRVCQCAFERQYGPLADYHIFALLPSYLERDNASLVTMADYFIRQSNSELSGFYLDDYQSLQKHLSEARQQTRQVLLLGVTFALLELAEQYQPDLSGVIVMETGGMKGRRKEIIREELHQILKMNFNIPSIHSEYGMTELLSQAYSTGEGVFSPPSWMRIMIRDVNDPFWIDNRQNYGGINVIDLANVDSCAFVETQDLGRLLPDSQHFEVLGRFDNTDTRGCNLMVSV